MNTKKTNVQIFAGGLVIEQITKSCIVKKSIK